MNRIFGGLCLSIGILLGVQNPYKNLDPSTQLSLFVNYFISTNIQKTLPPQPQKEEFIKENENIDPSKYELYYNYIQRLKAIKQSNQEKLLKIEEKYRGKVAYYNSKLESVKHYYEKFENLQPLLKEAINNSFKVVYGKPIVKKFGLHEKYTLGYLEAVDIYGLKNALSIPLYFPKDLLQEKLAFQYDAEVFFTYENGILQIEKVIISVNSKQYETIGQEEEKATFKLNVKINDDIFQKIKIEE